MTVPYVKPARLGNQVRQVFLRVAKVPADGDYRMYIKNHAAQEAHFRIILDEPLTGPLV